MLPLCLPSVWFGHREVDSYIGSGKFDAEARKLQELADKEPINYSAEFPEDAQPGADDVLRVGTAIPPRVVKVRAWFSYCCGCFCPAVWQVPTGIMMISSI